MNRGNEVRAAIFLGLVCLFGLSLSSIYSYLLFHTIVELFSVVVACGIFTIAWNARRFMNNNYFLLIGIACLFVGVLDLLHTLAYKDMGLFHRNDPNLPTQLWVSARYVQASSFVIAPFFTRRKLNAEWTFAIYLAVTALLLFAIFSWEIFPDCFIEGIGLTPFKRMSEYLIALLLVVSVVLMRGRREVFDPEVMRLLSGALALLIVCELAFTLYADVFGISNKVGHFLKVAGFFFIYKALIEIGLTRPYAILFRDLKEANTELEKVNAELKDVNAELEAANAELETFNYTVSHDLRTPLANIVGTSQALLHLYGHNFDRESRQLVESITGQTHRMSNLITVLLNFSRLNRQELHLADTNLSNIALAVSMELRMKQPDRQVTFTIADGARCYGDPTLLRVVLENLLGNAWKYTGNSPSPMIEFGAAEVDGKSTFFVRDNGAGFDAEQDRMLFRPFQRLHGAEFEGLGIGLATVERIIQRHGGHIYAEGEIGKGATFSFTVGDS